MEAISISTSDRLKKLRVLSERGIDGEKENAKRLFEKLCNKYHISPDDIESSDERKMRWFRCKRLGWSKLLLCQCIFKTLGENHKRYTHGRHVTEIGTECTIAEGMEIELDYLFYSELLEKEIKRLVDLFIHKNDIFPPDCEVSEGKTELSYEDILIFRGIKKQTRTLQIAGDEDLL